MNSLEYWYYYALLLEQSDSLQKKIITEYEIQTGVAAATVAALEKQFKENRRVELDMAALMANAVENEKKEIRRKKTWKVIAISGIPVSFGAGVILTAKFFLR